MQPKNAKGWKQFVAKLKSSTKITLNDRQEAKELTEIAITKAVERRIPKKRFGVLFSGGVDSSTIAMICRNMKNDFICYSVGLEGAEDLAAAKKAAKKLKLRLKAKTIKPDEAEDIIRKTARIVPVIDVVSIGVGSVVYAAMEMAKKDKVKVLFSGLGSEEIFAGYERHSGYEKKDFSAKSIQKECWKGLAGLWERDMVRDLAIAGHFGMKIETPFLDEDVIRTAMRIPPEYKISLDQKKIILREAAESLGLPKEFAWRKKKAAQYGSNFDKAIAKTAKKHGFKYKKELLDQLKKDRKDKRVDKKKKISRKK
ncbi:hypothetical protein COV19_01025 [Candidatus Woesearchaeota archaeon CG10_big_fil_rev_8_21_14_0_10_44_13]|nr:MAG: hypothetical protein COV19_01025 [Candidatus Woesearchaeota archaeon CG10_big_fil_rev_8_21_14_0_10_44_13]